MASGSHQQCQSLSQAPGVTTELPCEPGPGLRCSQGPLQPTAPSKQTPHVRFIIPSLVLPLAPRGQFGHRGMGFTGESQSLHLLGVPSQHRVLWAKPSALKVASVSRLRSGNGLESTDVASRGAGRSGRSHSSGWASFACAVSFWGRGGGMGSQALHWLFVSSRHFGVSTGSPIP